MCGIAGSINIQLSSEKQAQILAAIAHRGPDDRGGISIDNIWLGNTRLAIQDLSNKGHQPMQSRDGRYAIVFNGEIYNHWELRKKLIDKGVQFHSDSDTETLLQCYIMYGEDCLPILNGIYAFAIYDKDKQELFIARDALGVKPLYYYQDGNQLLFASELKALLNVPTLDYTLNPAAFYNYLLLLYQPENNTPFQKIHKLAPGHFIRIIKGVAAIPTSFYKIPFDGNYNEQLKEKDWVNAIDESLNNAVNAQLLSDAPVGFFLSGGLDSSLIAAIAQKQNPTHKLQCFTVDTGGHLSNEGFADDLPFARKMAQHLGADLHEISGDINMQSSLDKMIWQLDEPQADPAALFVNHIAQAAANKGIKVLLSGAGADDVFSGYRRHQALYYQQLIDLAPKSFTRASIALLKGIGKENAARRLSKVTNSTGNGLEQRIATHFWINPAIVKGLFTGEITNTIPSTYQYFEKLLLEIPYEKNKLNQMLYWEMRTFLPHHNLNYTDKMSMAAGVETRVPYLDTELIALACKLPPALKMKRTQTKYILREVAKKYLPEDIIYRRKTGFGAPVRQWIKGNMSSMVKERLLSGNLERWNIFNPAAIEQFINDNASGKVDGAYTIFSLLAIESWLRQFAAK